MKHVAIMVLLLLVFTACTETNLTGQAGKRPVSSSTYMFSGLDLRESLVSAHGVFTASELPGLRGKQFKNKLGDVVYSQTLTLADDVGVNFIENEDDVVAPFLVVDTDRPFFVWEGSFSPSLNSEIGRDQKLSHLIGLQIPILGKIYSITDARMNGNGVEITFSDGANGSIALSDATLQGDFDGRAEFNNENIADAQVNIEGTVGINEQVSITKISYRLTMDSATGTTAYVPETQGIRGSIDNPNAMLGNWNIMFSGMERAKAVPFTVDSMGESKYVFTFTNVNGNTYSNIPLVSNIAGIWKLGDDEDSLVLNEHSIVRSGDYFILSSNGITSVLRYDSYDGVNQVVEFEELSSGSTINVPVGNYSFTIVVNGQSYNGYANSTLSAAPVLTIDMDGNGVFGGQSENMIHTANGMKVLLAFDVSALWISTVIETTELVETIDWRIIRGQGSTVDLEFANHAGQNSGNLEFNRFDFYELENEDEMGMSDYGALITLSGGTTSVKIDVPDQQISPIVRLTMG